MNMYQTNLSVWKEKITTIGLVVLNIFLFIISVFSGDLLYNEGAFSLQYVLYGKEWWRTITSMFLHADADHLVGNMLMLYFAGEIVEKYLGKRQYVILYFFSGITGSLFYAAYEFYTGSYVKKNGIYDRLHDIYGTADIKCE